MTHRVQRFLLLMVLAIIGLVAAQSNASAQFRYTCVFINGCKCIVILDPCGNVIGISCPCGSVGSGTFSAPRPIPVVRVPNDQNQNGADEPNGEGADDPNGNDDPVDVVLLNESLSPVDISAEIVDQTYGVVTTTLDASRTGENSTIVSNTATSTFPATGTIRFYANATVGSAPGVKYASRTELVFVNKNLQSVNPFVSEEFTLQEDVEFYNTSDEAQTTAFKLEGGTTTVTLGQ